MTPASETAWATREIHTWRARALSLVSWVGLILLKKEARAAFDQMIADDRLPAVRYLSPYVLSVVADMGRSRR